MGSQTFQRVKARAGHQLPRARRPGKPLVLSFDAEAAPLAPAPAPLERHIDRAGRDEVAVDECAADGGATAGRSGGTTGSAIAYCVSTSTEVLESERYEEITARRTPTANTIPKTITKSAFPPTKLTPLTLSETEGSPMSR